MQENVAATILRLSGWDGSQPLFDPFCGSSTLLMEAAMKQTRLPLLVSDLGFSACRILMPHLEPNQNRIKSDVTPLPEYLIRGSDMMRLPFKQLLISMLSEEKISTENPNFRSIKSLHNHCIITNPPYGIRMESPEQTKFLLKEFGDFLKQKCTGSTAFVYFGEPTLSKKIGLKPDQKWTLRTGGLEGILCRYPLY